MITKNKTNLLTTIFAAASVLMLMTLGACSKQEEYVEPQVDWRTKPPEIQERITEKVNSRDCEGLAEEVNALSMTLQPGQEIDHEMFNYIADKQVKLGCQ